MNHIRIFICAIIFGLFFSPFTAEAQSSSIKTDPSENFLPNIRVNIWGVEAGVYTYGLGVSIPVLWVHDRIKVAPVAGFFWNEATDGEFTASEFVYGGKILYYFIPRNEFIRESNHFYVGVGGMGTDYTHWDGREEHTRGGLVVGFEHFFDSDIKIGAEVQFGLSEGTSAYGALGVTIGWEWRRF